MNARSRVLVTVAAHASPSCSGSGSCPVGRTPAENGTCVDQKVVDFVACIDRANGSVRASSNGTKLSADVRAASVGVATAAEFQHDVSTRIYAGSDAQSQQILATCNAYVFGNVATQPPAPRASTPGPAGPTGPAAGPMAPTGPAAGPTGPMGAPPAGSSCGTKLAVPDDASWSLREREQWTAFARGVQGALDAANESCRARIGGSFIVESFRGHFSPGNTHGVDNPGLEHVRAPFNAVQQICDDGEMQKAAVRGRIQCIQVRFGGVGRSTWSLDGSVLTGTINPTGESDFDYRAEMRGPSGIRRAL